MKNKLIIVFILLYFQSYAQKGDNILYINKTTNEFLYFRNDTIDFRLNNMDAFGTYSIGRGLYKKRGKQYKIYNSQMILNESSIIKCIPRTASLIVLKVFYSDNEPVAFANVSFYPAKRKNNEILGTCNEQGTLILDEKVIHSYRNEKLFFEISTLGYSTVREIILKRGYDYFIYSTIPKKYSFFVPEISKITINNINDSTIVVEDWSKKDIWGNIAKAKLVKVRLIKKHHYFLFDKDVW